MYTPVVAAALEENRVQTVPSPSLLFDSQKIENGFATTSLQGYAMQAYQGGSESVGLGGLLRPACHPGSRHSRRRYVVRYTLAASALVSALLLEHTCYVQIVYVI